jgi:uncharacterized membrane protein YeaQ/YmgE (transglycosylase-associated protein family)
MDIMAIIGWIVFGFVVGVIARFIMPGRQAMGALMTILLGIAGSFFGGFLGSLFSGERASLSTPSGWIGSIIGAFLLLLIYGIVSRRA